MNRNVGSARQQLDPESAPFPRLRFHSHPVAHAFDRPLDNRQADPRALVFVLPVVIITSSSRESDREKACQLGASDYIVKPSVVNRIAEMVRQLSQRWLRAADS